MIKLLAFRRNPARQANCKIGNSLKIAVRRRLLRRSGYEGQERLCRRHENLKLKILIGLGFAFLALSLAASVGAVSSISSDNYEITWPNLNMGAGMPTAEGIYKLGVTTGQTAPGLYSSTGWKVRAGFWYIKSIIPFAFSISDISIEFGTLTPGTPTTQTNTLTVSVGGAGGYTVKASENKPLTSDTNKTIPDTTCDAGSCSQTSAGVWSQNTTYGFGFNMSGTDIPSDFVNTTYYRQFADRNSGESVQTVMSGTNVGKNKQATVTYKVNISNTQAAGSYRNYITFVATPTF